MKIQAFLTAYDPTDLPGTSIDPLGFERGYLFLADKILPGLTNVANRPRYFSVLCAGAYLSGDLFHDSPRTQYNQRLDRLTRLERFWALASVLATAPSGFTDEDLSGLRGVTYAKAKADDLERRREKQVNADFKLLSRQVQYGGVGMYGAVADRMHLMDRKILALSPDLGEKLGKGFIMETLLPKPLQKAVEENGAVDVSVLTEWGTRAHISGSVGKIEGRCFYDALHLDPIRSRMTRILAKHGTRKNETEQKRLSRIYRSLNGDKKNADLHEAIRAILFYEQSCQWTQLGLERMLYLCRQDQAGSVSLDALNSDTVMENVRVNLPKAVNGLVRALDTAKTEHFLKDLHGLDNIRMFFQETVSACDRGEEFTERVMARHRDVQRGKFDKGRRKMPWLEYVSNGKIALTSTRVGGLGTEATRPRDIEPHPYRLDSADALYRASRKQ